MITPRLLLWLPITILFVVFVSTLAPAQEASPQPPQGVEQPAGEAPPPPPAAPAPEAGTAPQSEAAPPADASPSSEAAPEQAANQPVPDTALPVSHDLSPWGMFMAADIVVKSVMVGLAIASVLTWTVLLAKAIELGAAKRKVARALAMIGSAHSLADAAEHSRPAHGPVHGLVKAAVAEHGLWFVGMDKSGLRDRVESRLDRLVAASSRRMTRGTGILATIGSTGPFVGLFGTVWGIMNSFIGISEAQTTNLAVVAPGIAEALLATAMGLVAAIPAVVIYNAFARSISGYKAVLLDASAELLRLVSRDIDRATIPNSLRKAAE
jgi:biopolymer transport protein ExbB